MRFALLVVLIATSGRSQYLIEQPRMRGALRFLEPQPEEKPLRCEVMQLHPALNFSFRFQAGYVVRVPMEQYFGPGHRWSIMTRITPEASGKPFYFGNGIRLPDVPKTKNSIEVGGGYQLGEERYSVRWVLADETGRVCRRDWTIDAKLAHSEHSVKVGLPPGMVSDLSLTGYRPSNAEKDDAAPVRLTVLLHAAPVFPRRTRLGVRDRLMLLGTVSALLERMPTRSVRLVAFNLDQQKELFREDDFQLAALDRVAQAMQRMELGMVDIQVLQNRAGHLAMLSDLINRERNSPQPSDVVLFVGPMSRYTDKLPESWLEKPSGPGPQFYFLQYRPMFPPAQSMLPDTIQSVVSKVHGKTVIIRTPGDFAKAIAQVEKGATK